MNINIQICSKDRATECALLLSSLREQTHKDWSVTILDDASGTPLMSFYFIQTIINRLRHEGHRVDILRNNKSVGAATARQQLVDHALKNSDAEAYARIDDDTILDRRYLTQLTKVLDFGYDIASGVTPPFTNPETPRETRFVEPIINRIVLDDDGRFKINADDCGHTYLEFKILPAHHFRSNALMKREVHEKVSYEILLGKHSFREETFFSLRAIRAGFKIGVHTKAVAWHLLAPSGGERSHQTAQADSLSNQKLLNRMVRRWHKESPFIDEYNEKLGIGSEGELASLNKENNLLFTTEE